MALRTLLISKISPLVQGEHGFQSFALEGEPFLRIGAADHQAPHAVLLAFLDGNGDVGGFAVLVADRWEEARKPGRLTSTVFRIGSLTTTLK